MPSKEGGPSAPVTGLRAELGDFLRFVRRPSLGPRLPRRAMPALAADWVGCLALGRIVRWVLLLWAANLLVFGPLAAGAAWLSGVGHRFDPVDLPWLLALAWAPIVEELMFRFGLRRPAAGLMLVPAFAAIIAYGSGLYTGLFLALSLGLLLWPGLPAMRARLRWARRYRRIFPFVFHLLTLAFALLHLLNFKGAIAPWWLLPMLVLPQWATGLVLGWLRVRSGIGASIAAHALFNAGPMVLVWLIMQAAPPDGFGAVPLP